MYTVHTNNALAVSHCTLGLHTSTYGMYTKSKRQVNSLHITHPRQISHVFLQIELILRLLLPWILHLIPVSTYRNIINVLNANSISSIYLLVLLGVEKMCCLQTNFFKRIVFIAQGIFTISDHNIGILCWTSRKHTFISAVDSVQLQTVYLGVSVVHAMLFDLPKSIAFVKESIAESFSFCNYIWSIFPKIIFSPLRWNEMNGVLLCVDTKRRSQYCICIHPK